MKRYHLAIGLTCLLGSHFSAVHSAPAKGKTAKKAPAAKKPVAKPAKNPVQTYISSTRENMALTNVYLIIVTTDATLWTNGPALYEGAKSLGTLDEETKKYDPNGPGMKKMAAENLNQIKDLRASMEAVATAKPVPAKFAAFQTAFAGFQKDALPALAELESALKAENREKVTVANTKVKALREPFDKLDKEFNQLAPPAKKQ